MCISSMLIDAYLTSNTVRKLRTKQTQTLLAIVLSELDAVGVNTKVFPHKATGKKLTTATIEVVEETIQGMEVQPNMFRGKFAPALVETTGVFHLFTSLFPPRNYSLLRIENAHNFLEKIKRREAGALASID